MSQEHLTVLYIITKLELGGAQKVCLALFNDLPKTADSQKASIKTLLITGPDGILIPHVADKHNNTVHLLATMQREVHYTKLFQEIINFCSLVNLIRALKKQHKNLIVHTHSTKAGILGRWAAWLAGVPIRVHTIHGYGFNQKQSWFTWLLFYCAELFTSPITSHYICVSQEDITTGRKYFPNFTHKQSLIRAAAHCPKPTFLPATIEPSKKNNNITFGSIACFKPQKNCIELLQAFAYVNANDRSTRLEIIGDGVQRQLLEEFIQKHNLQHVVTLHGWQDNILPFLTRWDAFVLSSLWEGLPCSIIEAQIFKLPVFAYNVGGIKEVIISGKNGLLVKPHAWLDLANGMLDFIKNPRKYKNFTVALTDFTKETMIQKHLQLYKEIAAKK